MNAETRAKEIVDAENQFCEEHSLFVRGDTLDRLEVAIATALRQAENDKLEEAARHCDGVTEELSGGRKQTHASPYFASLIRSLKSKG